MMNAEMAAKADAGAPATPPPTADAGAAPAKGITPAAKKK